MQLDDRRIPRNGCGSTCIRCRPSASSTSTWCPPPSPGRPVRRRCAPGVGGIHSGAGGSAVRSGQSASRPDPAGQAPGDDGCDVHRVQRYPGGSDQPRRFDPRHATRCARIPTDRDARQAAQPVPGTARRVRRRDHHLGNATVPATAEIRSKDDAVRRIIANSPKTAATAQQLLEKLSPHCSCPASPTW